MANRVLTIQSHVVHGYVGNKVAVFCLQVLGMDVDPINSVQFSCHTGCSAFRGQVLQRDQLSDLQSGLELSGILDQVEYSHLLTGYIGSVGFLEGVVGVFRTLREKNPGITYVCDPVLGDNGKLYVPKELVACYRKLVVPLATVLTPNQFEVELLTGIRIRSRSDAARACDTFHARGVRTVVITSVEYDDSAGKNLMTVFASHRENEAATIQRREVTFPKLPYHFTGTGDLTAALFLARMHQTENADLGAALVETVATVQAVLARTAEQGTAVGGAAAPELRLVQSQADIVVSPVGEFLSSSGATTWQADVAVEQTTIF